MKSTQSIESMIDVLKAFVDEHPIEKRESGTHQDWRPHDPRDGFNWYHWEYRRREHHTECGQHWCEHITWDGSRWLLHLSDQIIVSISSKVCPFCRRERPHDH